jgi:hypothetical protein
MGQLGIKVSSKTGATEKNIGSSWPDDSLNPGTTSLPTERFPEDSSSFFGSSLKLCPISFLHSRFFDVSGCGEPDGVVSASQRSG